MPSEKMSSEIIGSVDLRVNYRLNWSDFDAYSKAISIYIKYIRKKNRGGPIRKTAWYNPLLNILIFGAVAICCIQGLFFLADNFPTGTSIIVLMLTIIIPVIFGFILGFYGYGSCVKDNTKYMYSFLVDLDRSLKVCDDGVYLSMGQSIIYSPFDVNFLYIDTWKDYLFLISPEMIVTVPQRATTEPVSALKARILQVEKSANTDRSEL